MRASLRKVAPLLRTPLVGFAVLAGTGAPTARALPAPAAAPTTTAPALGAGVPAGPPALLRAPSTAAVRPTRRSTAAPPTTRARRGLATPEAAARNLWDGWRDDDRPRARLFATRGAVDALFVRRWDPSMRDAGCAADGGRDPSRHVCTFRFVDGRAELLVVGDAERGHRVTAVKLYGKETTTTASGTTPGVTAGAATTQKPSTRARAKAKS